MKTARPMPGGHLPFRAWDKPRAELIVRAAAHGVAGDDVLGHRVLHETFGRDDLNSLPDVSAHDAAHAAKMVERGECV